MRCGHVLVVGTLVIVAVTAGTVMFLARGGSSAPTAGAATTATATTGATGGNCIQYPYSGAPYSSLTIIPDGTATLCRSGLGSGPIKVSGGKTSVGTAASTGDSYCIEDTADNGTWHVVNSADGDIRLVRGPCPG